MASESAAMTTTGVARGSAIFILALFLMLALNYAFNLALAWLLPTAEFGVYGICQSIFLILAVLVGGGIPGATTKFISEHIEDEAKKVLVYRSSLLGNFLLALLISGLFYLLYSYFLSLERVYERLIPVILMMVVIASLGRVNFSALVGLFRFGERALAEVLEVALKLLFGIGLVLLGYGVFGALAGYLTGILFATVISAFFLRDTKPWQGRSTVDFKLFSFASFMLLVAIAMTLTQNIDILGVKFLLEPSIANQSAGYYRVAMVLAQIPVYITMAMMGAVFPFISRFGQKKYAPKSIKYTLLFVFPISIALAFLPHGFIKLFFPEAYLEGVRALAILAIGMGFLSLSLTLTRMFQGVGTPRIPAFILLGSVAVQLWLLVTLIPRLGITGAAISTTVACFVGAAILSGIYGRRFKPELKAKQILSVLVSFAVLAAIVSFMPSFNRVMIVLTLIVAAAGYLLVLSVLRLLTGEDIDIMSQALPGNERIARLTLCAKRLVLRLNHIG